MLHVHLAYQTQLEKFRDDEDSRCKMDGADWVSVFVVSGHGNPSSFASSIASLKSGLGFPLLGSVDSRLPVIKQIDILIIIINRPLNK